MKKAMASKQHGISLEGFLVVVVILLFVSLGAMRVGPVYMQDKQLKSVFDAIVHDPEMQKATTADIRVSFKKRASIADIKAVAPEDIEISRDGDKIVLSVNYSVKVPLAANASLLFEFSTSSSK